MRFKKQKPLLSILLGAGLYLFDSLREHLPDNVDDTKGKVRHSGAFLRGGCVVRFF
jgi:hypothetical protein